ncbi:MAG: GrpB family protein [Clostridiales bacterium]|nr:GrpB family protein [Clostridiales bacterium]
MTKKLSEMTLEELWQLFPIILSEHSDNWQSYYLEEEAALKRILPGSAIITHIGSTAIPNIWAKPIVDILVEVDGETMNSVAASLSNNGYIIMSRAKNRISLNKGYTEQGFASKVFHLHLRCYGDNDEIYFRDYLIAHPEVAKQYEALKLSLWKQYEHDRDGYTEAKGEFVKKYTAIAKERIK